MERELDLCSVPFADRCAAVDDAFARLPEGRTLSVVHDDDPRPLRRRLEAAFPQVVWEQRRIGDGRWRVAIRKAEAQDGEPLARFLNRCAAFASATDRTRREAARRAVSRRIPRKSSVAEQGVAWPFLGAVCTGRLFAIAGTPEGRDQILFEVAPNDVFGDVLFFDSGTTIARFVTLAEPAHVILFPREDVVAAAKLDSGFAFGLAVACAQHARAAVELVCAHVSKPAVSRLAAALLAEAPIAPGLAPLPAETVRSLRIARLAAAAGTVTEVAARCIATLETAGAVQRVRGRIAYLDRAKLKAFV